MKRGLGEGGQGLYPYGDVIDMAKVRPMPPTREWGGGAHPPPPPTPNATAHPALQTQARAEQLCLLATSGANNNVTARGGGGDVCGSKHSQTTPATTSTTPNTPTTGLRERGNDTGRSGRQKAATRRNRQREERVTVQGPVTKQQHDGMSHRGGCMYAGVSGSVSAPGIFFLTIPPPPPCLFLPPSTKQRGQFWFTCCGSSVIECGCW